MLKIFAIPLGVFMFYPIALGFKIYYAIETHQPVIREDYYQVTQEYDKFLKENNTGNRLVESPILNEDTYKAELGEVVLPFKVLDTESNKPVTGAEVKLHLSRMATVNEDINGSCTTDDSGECKLALNIIKKGPWEFHVSSKDPGGAYSKLVTYTIK